MTKAKERSPGILIVDDEPTVSRVVKHTLAELTLDVVIADSGKEAIEICAHRSFDLVISDVRMPEMDGIELLQILAHDYPSMRRIILTGYADMDQTVNAINAGRVNRYLTKPWPGNDLVNVVSEELRIGEKDRLEISRLRDVIDKLSDN